MNPDDRTPEKGDPEEFQHYFSRHHHGPVKKGIISFDFHGQTFSFHTTSGTFSKDNVDTGTRVLLEEFWKHEEPEGHSILDLGCGYGTVGIIIGKLFPANNITFVDINEDAIKIAKENAKRNGLADVEWFNIDFRNMQSLLEGRFHHVLFNPPVKAGKDVMEQLIRNALLALRPAGNLYVVVKTSLGAKSWQTWFSTLENVTCEVYKKSGYRVFKITN